MMKDIASLLGGTKFPTAFSRIFRRLLFYKSLITWGSLNRGLFELWSCIPYRVGSSGLANGDSVLNVEVLMITSQRGEGLLFPKGGWETDETVEEAALREALEEAGVRGILKEKLGTWDFKSKRQQGEFCPEGLCRANMFALRVTEQLDTWPEQHARQRRWFPLTDALQYCRVEWMQDALHKCKAYLSITPNVVSPSTVQHSKPISNHLPSQGRSLT